MGIFNRHRVVRLVGLAVVLWDLGGIGSSRATEPMSLALQQREGRYVVVATHLPAELFANRARGTGDWSDLLRVSVHHENGSTVPAMFGDYQRDGAALVFRPRYPFRRGVTYSAVLHRQSDRPLEYWFSLPEFETLEPTRVSAVYPSSDRLPENLLKFYVHFSAPMRQAVAYDHVCLLRGDGTPIDDPFVNVGQELWDRSGTRLTLLFDPGRIKHGLLPREQLGPLLEVGNEYVLVIEAAWKDSQGRPLAGRFEKRFAVTAADTEPPDPARWRISRPRLGTTSPLEIAFPEPLDHALALHSIKVLSPDGKSILGEVTLTNAEQHWQFTPSSAWSDGQHSIVVDGRLEDLAAHSVGRPFEAPMESGGQTPPVKDTVRLPLRIE